MKDTEQIIEYGSILELNDLKELNIEKEIDEIVEYSYDKGHISSEDLEKLQKIINKTSEKIKEISENQKTIRRIILTYMEGGIEDNYLDEEDITKTIIDRSSEINYITGIDVDTGEMVALNGLKHENILEIKNPKKKIKKEEIEEYRQEILDKEKIYFIENETEIVKGVYLTLTNKGFLTIQSNSLATGSINNVTEKIIKTLLNLGIESVKQNQVGDFQGKIELSEEELKKIAQRFKGEYKNIEVVEEIKSIQENRREKKEKNQKFNI
jgi:hypothetical protein